MEQEDAYDKYEYLETTTSPHSTASTTTTKPSLYRFLHFNPPLDKVPVPTGYPKDYNIISTNNNVI